VLAYLPVELLDKKAGFEVEAFCKPVKASLQSRVLYDAGRQRLIN
jgi:hypothetical protein